jgi:hypothetical protein
MVNMKVIEGGRRGSQFSESKEIRPESEGSIPPIADSKALHCVGQLCKTSKVDMAQGACARSSTIL